MLPRGFTLIELLIAVAVLAITLALAIPSYSLFIQKDAASAGATNLSRTLNYARSEAVSRDVSITINPVNANWHEGWVINEGVNVVRNIQSADSRLVYVGAPASVEYLPTGFVNITPGTELQWTITPNECVSEAIRRISLNALGRVKVETLSCP
ncbi:prepilin-type N-terminal cleavage/methylation domain-containing protein [Alginatibacterium sediminis]|uniref:Type II secretion system protein H n=1 Tax=Alginatibacterium sediminis TaxID=2164068 RepID=A0A420EDY3_9ALTE|nr:GspH/FimT family pseudopilin [Alginatibacterium sediminis]RKF18878.1 prepilin-type N-terminal cleavage/methylation domain-containing protein [Alginatibacterium sediminis]